MKKLFEKHTVAKMLGILLFAGFVLTWIFKTGVFQQGQFYDLGSKQLGFSDIPTIIYQGAYIAIDKIIFLLVLGGFYAVLSKTSGYNKLVSGIVKKLKGKETIFTIIVAIVFAGLTSVTTNTFALILFVPFVITILLNLGLNKITAFAATFGAILVGVLGATIGTDALKTFDYYFSVALSKDTGADLTIKYRIIILCISVALYSFFLYFASKKALDNKKKSSAEIEEEYKIEDVSKKKGIKTLPIIIVLSVLTIIFILGFFDWSGVFKIECFNNFHKWLTEIKIGKDFTVVAYLLGTTAVPFGAFDLFALSIFITLFTILIGILYSTKFEELIQTFGKGVARVVKPVGALVGVYALLALISTSPIIPTIDKSIMQKDGVPDINIDYNGVGFPIFNIDENENGKADDGETSNPMNRDLNNDGKCDLNCDTNKDGFPDKNIDFNNDGKSDDTDASIAKQLEGGTSTIDMDTDGDGIPDVNVDTDKSMPKTILAAILTHTFHSDLGYTGYSIGSLITNTYSGENVALGFLIFFALYGLLQFVLPTSIILITGLAFAKVDYKDWMKYIWRFALGMFFVLLIMFIFMGM